MVQDKYPLVYVRWKDHTADGKWIDIDKFHKPAVIHSIGWKHKEDDEGITIVACYLIDEDNDHNVSNAQYILKSTIIERIVLKAVEGKK